MTNYSNQIATHLQQHPKHHYDHFSAHLEVILSQIEEIRSQNKLSITEIMEGCEKSSTHSDFHPLFATSSTFSGLNQKYLDFQSSDDNFKQCESHPQKVTHNPVNSWIPYLQKLVQSHDKKVRQVTTLTNLIQSLCQKIRLSQEEIQDLSHHNQIQIEKIHEYETWYEKDRQEIDILHERVQLKEKQVQHIFSEKQYWEEQFNILKSREEKIIFEQGILEKQNQSLTREDSINHRANSKSEEAQSENSAGLFQTIEELTNKLLESEKLNENVRFANKMLEKQLIKMGENLMKMQMECDQLRSENELLAQQIQELYNQNLSRSFSQKGRDISDFHPHPEQDIFQRKIIERDDEEQDQYNIFEQTRTLMMFGEREEKGNRISDQLYQVRNLSVSSSKESLLSLKQKIQAKYDSKFENQVYYSQIEQTPDQQNTSIQTKKKSSNLARINPIQFEIPKLHFSSSQSPMKQSYLNDKKFMKKSIIQTLQTQQNSESGINKIIRGIVLKRIGKNLGNKKKEEETPKKGLTERLAENSWTERIVTKRIRGKSPKNKNKDLNKSSQKIVQTERQVQSFIECPPTPKKSAINRTSVTKFEQLEKNAQMAQSMYIPSKQPPKVETPKRSALMNYLVGAVVKNRIRK